MRTAIGKLLVIKKVDIGDLDRKESNEGGSLPVVVVVGAAITHKERSETLVVR